MRERESQPSMRDIVIAEMAKYYGKTEAERMNNYLNNFYTKIPGSNGYAVSEEAVAIMMDENIDDGVRMLRAEHGHDLGRGDTVEQRRADLLSAGYSTRFVDNTRETFVKDIEDAIRESGVLKEELIAFVDDTKTDPKLRDTEELADILERLLLPVFIRLREKGYSHHDLRV